MPDFDEVTAIGLAGEGFGAVLDPAWFGSGAPHGGVLSAIALRAMSERAATFGHPPQMLSVRFLRAPREGALEVVATLERSGRRTATTTATLRQGDRECVRAAATFAAFDDAAPVFGEPAPEYPPAGELAPARRPEPWPPFTRALDVRIALGAEPFSGSGELATGGWLQTIPAHAVDAPFVAFLCDAWFPSPYLRLTAPTGVPTLDLTVHFLHPLTAPLAAEPVAVRFATAQAAGGLFVEDGALWSAGGIPLARSRQSALLLARD